MLAINLISILQNVVTAGRLASAAYTRFRKDMMNDELQELVRTPREDLDIELKQWMDMADKNVQAKLAKELLALRNHGGGYLVIGFKDEHPAVPDPARPSDLDGYSTDVFNNIVKKYAEPPFHCMSHVVAHPVTGLTYPVVVVPGGAKVPVRCKSDSPDGKSIKVDTYYIRRPGPESCPPQSGAEWDSLLQRCVLNRKDELLSALSAVLSSGGAPVLAGMPAPSHAHPFDELRSFQAAAVAQLEKLQQELEPGAGSRFEHGRYILSARILGEVVPMSPNATLDILRALPRYTGWSPMYVFNRAELAPYPQEDLIESWLGKANPDDAAHADFWRVSPSGCVTLIRGIQEDGPEFSDSGYKPGEAFELTLPAWRIAEFLLRVKALGGRMTTGPFRIQMIVEWTGLKGRQLMSHGRRRGTFEDNVSREDAYRAEIEITPDEVDAALASTVAKITTPLLRRFSFFEPPSQFYEQELAKLLVRDFV
jgi:hypothetical protein